ncbi:hypothetical protein PPL_07727 [Heterostelium album PN500]|uniref:Uncharacterized protein n=1 Tax=Heterostelium pallidum (strain ATCC 26659 / Pp 5 / PN500) TaxID=670386 RepID=D3BGS5_HETP5|nr:hypothetical protein PPL_07727 [Heterostelium album PN500]EFA79309.1 hypothetical protein PPL_07727 [Heterostelium album PN500]|eukprot:XP_020431430.1 hypothetical protein PPL_07727 [Heterostelium album PN500]
MLQSLEEDGIKIFEIIVKSVQKKHGSSSKSLEYLGQLENQWGWQSQSKLKEEKPDFSFAKTIFDYGISACWNPIIELVRKHDRSIDLFNTFVHDHQTCKNYVINAIGEPIVIPKKKIHNKSNS